MIPIEKKFWLVWVDEGGRPCKKCKSLEIAIADANRLRDGVTKKHIYIMECVDWLEGRGVLKLREKQLAESKKQG